jgi:hypothetical protein
MNPIPTTQHRILQIAGILLVASVLVVLFFGISRPRGPEGNYMTKFFQVAR